MNFVVSNDATASLRENQPGTYRASTGATTHAVLIPVPAINVPTPVRYFRDADGGVSHCHYLRDNLLLMFMYLRLFVELVPRLVGRRFRSFRH